MPLLHLLLTRLPDPTAEEGFSTAELLANAALGVAAIAVIWAGMEGLGTEVMDFIRGQLFGG
jgi:hypothetical protein